MAKSGSAWHKCQLSTLRAIISDGLLVRDHATKQDIFYALKQQFIGACRPVNGTKIPAYHDPLVYAVKEGQKLFHLEDNEFVNGALEQIAKERKRVKKAKAAKQAAAVPGDEMRSAAAPVESGVVGDQHGVPRDAGIGAIVS